MVSSMIITTGPALSTGFAAVTGNVQVPLTALGDLPLIKVTVRLLPHPRKVEEGQETPVHGLEKKQDSYWGFLPSPLEYCHNDRTGF